MVASVVVTPPSTERKTRLSRPLRGLQQQLARPRLPLGQYELFAVTGPDIGKAFALAGDPVRVGHTPDNDVQLSDETVSQHHLTIQDSPAGYLVRDLESTNGTRVNGVPVHEALLLPGADITVGDTTLRFQVRRARGA